MIIICILVIIAICMTYNIYKTNQIRDGLEDSIGAYMNITGKLSSENFVMDYKVEKQLEKLKLVEHRLEELRVDSNIIINPGDPLLEPENIKYIRACVGEYINLYDECYEEKEYNLVQTCNASVIQKYNSNCYFCVVGEYYALKGNKTAVVQYFGLCSEDMKNYLNI